MDVKPGRQGAEGLLLWARSLLVKPFGKCWLCRGKRVRVVKGRRKTRKCLGVQGRRTAAADRFRTVQQIRRTAVAGQRGRLDGGE